jgi:hypothetical protein
VLQQPVVHQQGSSFSRGACLVALFVEGAKKATAVASADMTPFCNSEFTKPVPVTGTFLCDLHIDHRIDQARQKEMKRFQTINV